MKEIFEENSGEFPTGEKKKVKHKEYPLSNVGADDYPLPSGMSQMTVSDYSSIKRKQWVLDQYLLGRYPFAIKAEFIEVFKRGEDTFEKDVHWVQKELRKRGDLDLDSIINKHTDFYYDNYRQAKEKGDIRSANQSLKQIEDLLKIHDNRSGNGSTKQTNIQVNNINLPKMSLNEIRSLLGKDSNPLTVDDTDSIDADSIPLTDSDYHSI